MIRVGLRDAIRSPMSLSTTREKNSRERRKAIGNTGKVGCVEDQPFSQHPLNQETNTEFGPTMRASTTCINLINDLDPEMGVGQNWKRHVALVLLS